MTTPAKMIRRSEETKMITIYNRRKKMRLTSSAAGKGEIPRVCKTHLGVVRAWSSGIVLDLDPPLDKLSGPCAWTEFPRKLAVLKLLLVGDDEAGEVEDVVSKLGLAPPELNQLDEKIGRIEWHIGGSAPVYEHESNLCASLNSLLSWGARMSAVFPLGRSVAQDLSRLPSMPSWDLAHLAKS